MKVPKEAPTFNEAFERVTKGSRELGDLIQHSGGPLVDGKYLHWDELLHRKPPGDLSVEEWWFLLKLHRQSPRQELALRDKAAHRFSYVQVEPVPRRLHEIDLRAGGQIKMPEQVTNRETRDSYYVSSLIEEAITSSQLEGATTTRQVAKEMLRSGRQPQDRSERMILNNFLTMRRISTLKAEPLSRDLIFELHRLVTNDTLDDATAAGRFRREDETIAVYDDVTNNVLHQPPAASELEGRALKLCEFANQTDGPFVHPVIRSIILHFLLAYDHPFVDGNGRTARALFYWSMLRHGYWVVEFISISQIVLKAPAKYGRAFLHSETDEGDLTYFILYHLNIIMKAIDSLHEYIARKTEEIRRFEKELRGSELLNHRQRALIRHAARHPGQRYTVEGHRASHSVSYESARSDLLDLANRGLFIATKERKKWIFTPERQLMGKLAAIGAGGTATLISGPPGGSGAPA